MGARRNPSRPADEGLARRKGTVKMWAEDGLKLNFNGPECRPDVQLGNTLDSQRLIMLAREQGKEDAMIEAVYAANHERNECLADHKVLLAAAIQAGVTGAEQMLRSDWGKAAVNEKVRHYQEDLGIHGVPVIVLQEKYVFNGAQPKEVLAQAFQEIIETGATRLVQPRSGYSIQA